MTFFFFFPRRWAAVPRPPSGLRLPRAFGRMSQQPGSAAEEPLQQVKLRPSHLFLSPATGAGTDQNPLLAVSGQTAVTLWKVAGCSSEQDVHLRDRSDRHRDTPQIPLLFPLDGFIQILQTFDISLQTKRYSRRFWRDLLKGNVFFFSFTIQAVVKHWRTDEKSTNLLKTSFYSKLFNPLRYKMFWF